MGSVSGREDAGLETQLRRQAVSQRLFGVARPVAMGRFRLLARVGAGAMGTVYRAHDRTLEREVALKVLQRDLEATPAARAHLSKEARALARLSHPNVVIVHEVGEENGHTFIAMELIDGGNLDEYLARLPDDARRFDTVVDLLMQAGRGLVSAHDAGIVHRDFKPANVLVGSDGRVRVADFGLARAVRDPGDDATGQTWSDAGAGTPAYMAPEQHEGRIDARADQFSFCLTFWEALWGHRPDLMLALPRLPSKLSRRERSVGEALRRGLSESPEARFASMADLLDVLERARSPSSSRRGALAFGLGALGIAAGAGTLVYASVSSDLCDGGRARLDGAWDADRRDAHLAALSRMEGDYPREAEPRIRAAVDRFTDAWGRSYRDACIQNRRGGQSDTMLDRRVVCLENVLSAFEALGRELSEHVQPNALPALVAASRDLPRPEGCDDVALLVESGPPEPVRAHSEIARKLAQARVFLTAGDTERARTQADSAIESARELKAHRWVAEGLVVSVQASIDQPGAIDRLEQATRLALSEGDVPLAVEAWARGAWGRSTLEGDPRAALEGHALIEALAQGLRRDDPATNPSAPFATALLYNNLGTVYLSMGEVPRARELFERSLAFADEVEGRGTYELLSASTNLALATSDRALQTELFDSAIGRATDWLGGNHPFTLQSRYLAAVSISSSDPGASLSDVCDRYDRFHPDLVVPRSLCRYDQAWSQFASRGTVPRELFAMVADDGHASIVAGAFRRPSPAARAALSSTITDADATEASGWRRTMRAEALICLGWLDDDPSLVGEGLVVLASELTRTRANPLAWRLETGVHALRRIEGETGRVRAVRAAIADWRAGRRTVDAIARALEP